MPQEGKLAETAPNRPLALTIGAAAVTLLVVIGVLAGPSLVNCFNSPDGMGVCLRGELSEMGIVPAPADDTPAVAATAPADAEAETAIAEPELDVTPPDEAQDVPENLIAATFGLLRAEPDGSLVIAGSGTPGSEVEVYADDELLGRATVEPSGDWVLVPEAPIPPGGSEITLAEAGKEGRAEQSFVVVIDPEKTEQPLVVASTPGEASEILQGLERPEAGETIAVASADMQAAIPEAEPEASEPLVSATAAPAAEPGTATQAPASEEDAVGPAQVASAPANEAPETTAVATALSTEATAPVTAEPEPEAPRPAATEAPATEQPVTEPEPVAEPEEPLAVASAPEQSVPEPAPSTSAAASDVTAEASASSEAGPAEATVPDTQTAAVDPQVPVQPAESSASAEPALALADVPPTIDAIEIDGDRSFFAGAGPEGAIMRLYVDDVHVADAVVEGGRWLIEAGGVLTGPQHRVRVDMLAEGSADVVARAEVNFVVDLPEAEQSIAVASAPEVEGQTTSDADQTGAPAAPAGEPEPATEATAADTSAPAETVPTAAPAASEDTAVATAGEDMPAVEQSTQTSDASAPAVIEAPATAQPVSEPDATAVAQAPEIAATAEPQAPGAADEPAPTAPEPAPAAEPETAVAQAPADEEVPTMVAVPVGDAEGLRFASGRAIIRRGDNLWTIARRVYGEGIKYTTIYEANAQQIRDPDRIYPGQVFELPAEAL